MKRRICVVTGSRAEYGLLYWLMKEIQADQSLELQVIATGMHLSPEFGLTYKIIEDDGFIVNDKIEILLSSDSTVGITKSIGLGLISFSESLKRLCPDVLVVLGDRFEILSAAVAATILRIPIAHIHGGEATEGLIDEPFRHSVTKMSHLHFTSTEEYRKRVIQLGEDPKRVFNVGAVGLDNIYKLKLLSKKDLENELGFEFGNKNLIVTYHPVTLENSTSEAQFGKLLKALDRLEDTKIIFTKPNSDTDGRIIVSLIDNYVKEHIDRAAGFTSLGQLRYLSTLQYVDGMVGNSSSGLIEMPSFKKGTINIGDRQLGRVKAVSVIDCEPEADSIHNGITKMYSDEFINTLKGIENPYGAGGSSILIKNNLAKANLNNILKKKFYDIDFSI